MKRCLCAVDARGLCIVYVCVCMWMRKGACRLQVRHGKRDKEKIATN